MPVLVDLAPTRQADVLAALAAVETADAPVKGAHFRALLDPALRTVLAGCVAETGRVLLKVGDGWLSGYDDQVGELFATQGLGVLPEDDRAVLTLVLIHCVAIPRANGHLTGNSWLDAEPMPRTELSKSQIPENRIRASLQRLRDAGILGYGERRSIRPGPQFLRLTPSVSEALWQNLILLAQPDGVLADVIRRHRTADRPGTGACQSSGSDHHAVSRTHFAGADMTTTFTAGADSNAEIGIIGNRHLVALQTIDIARLTTHPVPLVPGTFIAVSGQGPKGDSNGSGKTSFLAAISLLLGDAQWRLEANGSQAAPKLLFSLPSAGLDKDSGYSSADCGYVIGVFAEKENPVETALTVWVRISSTPQYLRVRWTHGLHVAEGDTDAERYEQADALWQALPKDHEIGPKHLRTKLYGTAPKGIAYVDTSMRKSAPSLLSQQMTEMTPDQIGVALIELTGRQGLLETEEEQRALLATHQADLAAQEQQDRDNRRREGRRTRRRAAPRTIPRTAQRGRAAVAAPLRPRLSRRPRRRHSTPAHHRGTRRRPRRGTSQRRGNPTGVSGTAGTHRPCQSREGSKRCIREGDGTPARSRTATVGEDREARRLNEDRAHQQRVAADGAGLSVPEAEERLAAARGAHGGADFACRQANQARDNAERELAAAQQGVGLDTIQILLLITMLFAIIAAELMISRMLTFHTLMKA